MEKGRLEAFSDGVIAILITIMVLELKVPLGTDLASLLPLIPVILSYVLSFVYLGIYWNNHHHLFQAVEFVDGRVLWANMHLLFWLSLIPFVTGWMGENEFAPVPILLYGVVMWMTGLAYYILTRALIARHGKDSMLAVAVGRDVKGLISLFFYTAAVLLALSNSWISLFIYALVAIMWFIPDPRIERRLDK